MLLGALITAGVTSSAGLRALISLVSGLPAISLNVTSASGRLADAWQLEEVTLETSAALITIDRLSVDWRPAELLQRKLHINDISLQGLSIALRPGDDDVAAVKAERSFVLPSLPLSLLIDRLQIEKALILSDADMELIEVEQFLASFSSDEDSLTIGQVLLHTPDYGFDLHGQLQITGENSIAAQGTWWTDFQQFNKMTGEVHVDGTLTQTEVALSMTSPAEVARRLNVIYPMDASGEAGQYFTIVYGILDTQTGQFRFVAAGHPDPVLVRHGEVTEIVDEPAFPIGMIAEAEYTEAVVDLRPGDRLYMHSDGVNEEMNDAGEQLGTEKLGALFLEGLDTGLEESIEHVIKDVISWRGDEHFADDVSIMAVEMLDG